MKKLLMAAVAATMATGVMAFDRTASDAAHAAYTGYVAEVQATYAPLAAAATAGRIKLIAIEELLALRDGNRKFGAFSDDVEYQTKRAEVKALYDVDVNASLPSGLGFYAEAERLRRNIDFLQNRWHVSNSAALDASFDTYVQELELDISDTEGTVCDVAQFYQGPTHPGSAFPSREAYAANSGCTIVN